MKRAKLRGLKRDASVVLGNVGTEADVPALAAAAYFGEADHSFRTKAISDFGPSRSRVSLQADHRMS